MRRRRRYYTKLKPLYIGLCIAVMAMVTSIYFAIAETALPVSTGSAAHMPTWRDVLFSGIPGIAGSSERQQPVKVNAELTPKSFVRSMVLFLAGVDIHDTKSVFRVELPLMAAIKLGTPTVSAMSLPNFPKFDPKNFITPGKPLVGIYHTHTSESFVPTSGVTHQRGGKTGDIVNVGQEMAKRLEGLGIKTEHSANIHDYPSFMKAYSPAEETAKKMLAENPSIQMIFDIHRDADKRENSLVTVNGMTAARITIVVATGQQELVQPHWQQNHAFAKLIDAKLNQHYPGVSRGIQLVDWRYNQHLHPRALLVEVGCQENTEEEAKASIDMLADVVAEIIAESN